MTRLAALLTLRSSPPVAASSTSPSSASSPAVSTSLATSVVTSILQSVPLITYSHFLPRRDLIPRLAVMNKATLPLVVRNIIYFIVRLVIVIVICVI